MIIAKTPLRVSLFGGGSDIPEFFRQHGGAVLGGAIDKFVYCSLIKTQPKLFDYKVRLAYRKSEYVSALEFLEHKAAAAILRSCGLLENIEVTITADLPARVGLGSSSSFAVGLLNVAYTASGSNLSARALAEKAIEVERGVLSEAGGWQDQIFAAHGGLSLIEFSTSGNYRVSALNISAARRQELESHLYLFFTGLARDASSVERRKIERMERLRGAMSAIRDYALEAADILTADAELSRIGRLLHDSWMLKRELSEDVSSPVIDEMYDEALRAGASGGKLLGAGAGGFLLLFCSPCKVESLRAALRSYTEVPFSFVESGSAIFSV